MSPASCLTFMDSYSIFALIFAALTLLTTLVWVRRRNKQQQEALMAAQQVEQEEFHQIELIRVQNPTPQDLQAYELIESEIQKVWKSFSISTSIAPKRISQMALDLIQKIAAIYYPDIEYPEFQASIFDLLELNYRVIERVKDQLEEFPLNTIKDLNIQDILKYKTYYDRLTEWNVFDLARKYKYVYTIGRYAWMGYNALNPWYWGKKMMFTGGREVAYRYLLKVVLTIVGEEAVLVYSKRNLKAKMVAVEKNIALEMINMAVSDGEVYQGEYEVILNFVLNNSRLDDQMKVTLLKTLLRKRSSQTTTSVELYDEEEKKRLIRQVERVAKADKRGSVKKQELLKALEDFLGVTSEYRAQLALSPPEEMSSHDLVLQHRPKEEAILRLMVQAGAVEGALPGTLREYILQRAAAYQLPFNQDERQQIMREVVALTPMDKLTNLITISADKERTLSAVLEALLWHLPFTRKKEEFYAQVVSALDMKKSADKILVKHLQLGLPEGKLITRPPDELLRYLVRILSHDEQIAALQETATKHKFVTSEPKPKEKEATLWVCVTTARVLVVAAAMMDNTIFQHCIAFKNDLNVQIEPGKLSDRYILQGSAGEVIIESSLFSSSNLKKALELQKNRPREEAILRMMVQAGAIEGALPEALSEYIHQRASSYPLPFNDEEQEQILGEVSAPSPLNTLTGLITTKTDRERALTDVLDALLWYLPFTPQKEDFYRLTVAALDLQKVGDTVLVRRLEQLLPATKLVGKPSAAVLKYLFQLLSVDEQIQALQETATKYKFMTQEPKPKQKETAYWLCVTTARVLILASTVVNEVVYQYHFDFQPDDLKVQIERGRIYDTYILRGSEGGIRLENTLFGSANLKAALAPYLAPEQRAIEGEKDK